MNKLEPAGLDKDALEAAAQTVDPSGIFKLTWQECLERADAAIRAYLSALPAAPMPGVKATVTEAMAERFSSGMDNYWKGRKSGRDGDAIMAGLRAALDVPAHPEGVKDDALNEIAQSNEAASDDHFNAPSEGDDE